jgi:hypothetical protein
MKATVIAFAALASIGTAFGQEKVEEQKSSETGGVRIVSAKTIAGDAPLYIVDDVETTAEEISKLDPKLIESINVLKTAKDIEPYGEKGKRGVILIEMKGKKKKSLRG